MTIHDPLTTDAVLAAFDEHLRRTRGVCPEVRNTYARFVRAFLEEVFEGGPVDPARICVRDIVEFVSAMTPRYRPPTVQLVATSLRSFFRFLRAEGLRDDRIEEAVPQVPGRRLTSVPRHRRRSVGRSSKAQQGTGRTSGYAPAAVTMASVRKPATSPRSSP
jgi:integrase/recombinase XerD